MTPCRVNGVKCGDAPWLIRSFCGLSQCPDFTLCTGTPTSVWLNDNQLTELHFSLSKLKHPFSLNIQNNRFTALPQFLAEMPNLKEIRAHGNPFTDKQLKRLADTAEFSSDVLPYIRKLSKGQETSVPKMKHRNCGLESLANAGVGSRPCRQNHIRSGI